MASLSGFSSSRVPSGNHETTTATTPTGAPIRPRTCPRPMGLAHQDREVLGLEGADLLDVDTDVHP
jgi:hypothetical protein